jgi:hypothetical protein
MKRLIELALCLVALTATASLTSAQTLADAEVESAIKAGQAKMDRL